MNRYLLIFIILSFIPIQNSHARKPYKFGLFGGFSYVDYGGGFPDRFEGSSDTTWGAYTGITGGLRFLDGFARPGIELSPQYVMSAVDSFFQMHNIFIPLYGTLTFGQKTKIDIGAGTGPMFLDLYRENNTGWGVFGKFAALFPVREDFGGHFGPHVQIFTDLTTPGDNIWGILFGLSFEMFRGNQGKMD